MADVAAPPFQEFNEFLHGDDVDNHRFERSSRLLQIKLRSRSQGARNVRLGSFGEGVAPVIMAKIGCMLL